MKKSLSILVLISLLAPLFSYAAPANNTLLFWNGTNFTATGTPQLTVGYLLSTTTATSTFAGGINIISSTLATTTTVCNAPEICQYQTVASGASADIQIQRAINSLSGGGTVYIKRGTYTLSTTVTVPNNIRITGDGNATHIFVPAGGWNIPGFLASSTQNIQFDNILTDGTNQDAGVFQGDIAIQLTNTRNVKVLNTTAVNMKGFAIFINNNNWDGTAIGSSTETLIEGNYLQGTGNQDVIGGGPSGASGAAHTSIGTTSDVIISGNHIIQITNGASQPSNADNNCVDMVAVQNISVIGNECHGNLHFGIEKNSNSFSMISGNIVDEPLGSLRAYGQIIVEVGTGDANTQMVGPINITNNIIRSGNIIIAGDGTYKVNNLLISGNNIHVGPSGADKFIADKDGMNISNIAKGLIVGNNVVAFVAGQLGDGMYINNSTNVTVANNIIQDFGNPAIDLNNGSGNTSINNTFINDTQPQQNIPNMMSFNSGQFGIGTSTPWGTFTINPLAGQTSNQFVIGSSTATNFIVDNSGKVGVGTTTPYGSVSINAPAQANPYFAIGSSTSQVLAVSPSATGIAAIATTSVSRVLNLGSDPATTNSTTTIRVQKLQFEGLNSAGVMSCAFMVGTAWVIQAGVCLP